MPQLLCHLIGDYLLQNQWLADNKVKHSWVALLHALIYMVPFTIWFNMSLPAYCVMCWSHAVIDRYRLAGYWVRFYGIGVQPWWLRPAIPTPMLNGGVAANPPGDAPPWLQTMLLIVVDNTLHLCINAFSLTYL